MTTIGQMTLDELRRFVEAAIEDRWAKMFGRFEVDEPDLLPDEEPDSRTWDEVRQDIERDRWTPPPGAKSSLTLLREDRER